MRVLLADGEVSYLLHNQYWRSEMEKETWRRGGRIIEVDVGLGTRRGRS
jgi:hypothetical protein